MIEKNPEGKYPIIGENSYIHTSAVIIGNVTIGNNVFIAPNVVIRADEPGSFIKILDNSNIQDGVIIHSLEHQGVIIGRNCSIAHGAIIHGPANINDNSFIGFSSLIFKSNIGRNVAILHKVLIENVNIPDNKLVESGNIIKNSEELKKCRDITSDIVTFMKNVREVNLWLNKNYLKMKN